MAQLAVQPITDKTRISGGQVVFRFKGTSKYVKLGPVAPLNFTPNITETEAWTPEFGDRRLIGTWAVTKDGSITMTCEAWTEWLHQALFMSNKTYLVQSASSGTLVFEDVKVGDVKRLPGINTTVTGADDGENEPVDYIEDQHFTVHKSGMVEVIAIPEGAGDNLEVLYSIPAITADDKIADFGVMSNSGVRGELVIIGVVADGNPGEEVELTFWEVEFRPSGAVSFINTEGVNQVELTGRVFAVPGKAPGQSYGVMRSYQSID